jgi:hypothetical protein
MSTLDPPALDQDVRVMERHGHGSLRLDLLALQSASADASAVQRLRDTPPAIDVLGLHLPALRAALAVLPPA